MAGSGILSNWNTGKRNSSYDVQTSQGENRQDKALVGMEIALREQLVARTGVIEQTLADLADDGFLTPNEKPAAWAMLRQYVADQLSADGGADGLIWQADQQGVSRTTYNNAINTLRTYFNSSLGIAYNANEATVAAWMETTTTVASPSTYRSNVEACAAARQALLAQVASNLLGRIDTYADDGVLNTSEKRGFWDQYRTWYNEEAGILAQCDTLGILAADSDRSAYVTALDEVQLYIATTAPSGSGDVQAWLPNKLRGLGLPSSNPTDAQVATWMELNTWLHPASYRTLISTLITERADVLNKITTTKKALDDQKAINTSTDNLWPNPTSETAPVNAGVVTDSDPAWGHRYNASTNAYAGSYVRRLKASGTWTDASGRTVTGSTTDKLQWTVAASPGDQFYLGCQARAIAAISSSYMRVKLESLNGSDSVVDTSVAFPNSTVGSNLGGSGGVWTGGADGNYHLLECVIKSCSAGTVKMRATIEFVSVNSSADVYFDAIYFRRRQTDSLAVEAEARSLIALGTKKSSAVPGQETPTRVFYRGTIDERAEVGNKGAPQITPRSWQRSFVYRVGDRCLGDPSDGATYPCRYFPTTANGTTKHGRRIYKCTAGGTSSGSGVGPTGTGASISDNTVTWAYEVDPATANGQAVRIYTSSLICGSDGTYGTHWTHWFHFEINPLCYASNFDALRNIQFYIYKSDGTEITGYGISWPCSDRRYVGSYVDSDSGNSSLVSIPFQISNATLPGFGSAGSDGMWHPDCFLLVNLTGVLGRSNYMTYQSVNSGSGMTPQVTIPNLVRTNQSDQEGLGYQSSDTGWDFYQGGNWRW